MWQVPDPQKSRITTYAVQMRPHHVSASATEDLSDMEASRKQPQTQLPFTDRQTAIDIRINTTPTPTLDTILSIQHPLSIPIVSKTNSTNYTGTMIYSHPISQPNYPQLRSTTQSTRQPQPSRSQENYVDIYAQKQNQNIHPPRRTDPLRRAKY